MRLKWLLFKQGFKSIFKYKTQFFIISTLAFIASIFLSLIISVNTRISAVYNDIIKNNSQKFDYEYDQTVGVDKTSGSSEKDIYVQMNDFVKNNYTSITDKSGQKTSYANFYIAKQGDDDQTNHSSFVTDALSSPFFMEGWRELFVGDSSKGDDQYDSIKDYNANYNNEQYGINSKTAETRYGEAAAEFEFFSINEGNGQFLNPTLYAANFNSLNESFKVGSMAKSDGGHRYFRRFLMTIIGALMQSFNNEVKSLHEKNDSSNIIKQPLALAYYGSNTQAYTNWESIFNELKIPTTQSKDGWNDWYNKGWNALDPSVDNWSTEHPNLLHNRDFVYVYSAFESLAFEMLKKCYDYEKAIWTNYVSTDSYKQLVANPPTDKTLSEAIIKDFNDNTPLKLCQTPENQNNFNKTDFVDAANNHMTKLWSYLFGQNLLEDSSNNLKTIYYEQNMTIGGNYSSTLLNLKNKDGSASYNYIEHGLLGMLNPLSYVLDKEGNATSVKADVDYNIYGRYDADRGYYASRGGIRYGYNDIDPSVYTDFTESYVPSKKSPFIMEKYHQDMAAWLTGLNVSLREEGYLYDSSQKISFRFIVLDDNEMAKKNQYLKLLCGTMPISNNDVLIGEQYAIKKGLKLGSKISIAGVYKNVCGFATDSLSYYPVTNLDTVMPDVNNGVIVYLTKNNLRTIYNNSDSGISISMTNYYFINNNSNLANPKPILQDYKSKLEYFSAYKNTDNKIQYKYDDILNKGSNSEYWQKFDNEKKMPNDFKKTIFQFNTKVQDYLSTAIKLCLFIFGPIILLLLLNALVFSIKKNIRNNASQIAYMKAMGIRSKELSFSYVGTSIIVAFLIIPLAWVCSAFLQELVSRFFIGYLTIYLFQFIFNPLVLLGMVIGIGGFAISSSLLIAYHYNRKQIGKIIVVSTNSSHKIKIKKQKIKKHIIPFWLRFDIKIAVRNKNVFLASSFAIFVVMLLVSFLSFAPPMLDKYISDSQKFFSYKNAYTFTNPAENAPVSKTSLDAWTGPDYLEKNQKEDQLQGTSIEKYVEDYYDDPSLVNDSTNNTGIFSKFILSKDSYYDNNQDSLTTIPTNSGYWSNVKWMNDYLGQSTSDSNSFINMLLNVIPQRISNFHGFSLSAGELEQFSNAPLYTQKNTDGSGQDFTTISEREAQLGITNSLVATGLPQIINAIVNNTAKVSESDDWRKSIMDYILSYLPSTYSGYISSTSRIGQFSIGSGTETYVPGQETMGTAVTFSDSSEKNIKAEGLKNNQTAFNLDGLDTSSVFLKDNIIDQLNILFNDENKLDTTKIADLIRLKIYNPDTKTLNIPAVVNKTVNKNFDFDTNIIPESTYLGLNGLNYSKYTQPDIPKNAWVYDDRDYLRFQGKDDNVLNQEGFISPYDIDTSKYIYQRQYTEDNKRLKMLKDTSLFQEMKYDDGNLVYNIRPYYNYNNLRLYIPNNALSTNANLFQNGDIDLSSEIKDDNSMTPNQTGWYKSNVPASQVPKSVKDAWRSYSSSGFDDSGGYTYICPYNLKFSKLYNGSTPGDKHGEADVSDLDKEAVTCWADENIGYGNEYPITISSGKIKYNNINIAKINPKSILATFNDNIIIIDQDIANLLYGYNTSKFISLNQSPYTPTGKSYQVPNGPKIKTYDYKDISSLPQSVQNDPKSIVYGVDNLFNGNKDEATKYSTQPQWFNTKYSKFSEVTGETTGARAALDGLTGTFNAGTLSSALTNIKPQYLSVDLSSLRLGLIISISELILSLAILAITIIVFVSILYLMLLVEAFITNFEKFILVMKSLGYRNKDIIQSILGLQLIVDSVLVGVAIFLGYLFSRGALNTAAKFTGVIIPPVIVWWVPLLIISIFITSFSLAVSIPLISVLKKKASSVFKN
ncbi:ABC transporter permease [Spiroplasma endosymbiont of Aspidapion aeneum]|uniref:ABC transporter permease n=1 Tax=Spiroplasma endosymbiont of Aspidapion aeneum TaxID=3066276 RepID=UPI00313BA904